MFFVNKKIKEINKQWFALIAVGSTNDHIFLSSSFFVQYELMMKTFVA